MSADMNGDIKNINGDIKILIVSYFGGEPRVIAFHVKNGVNMRKITSQGKLDLSIVVSNGWHTAMEISYSF